MPQQNSKVTNISKRECHSDLATSVNLSNSSQVSDLIQVHLVIKEIMLTAVLQGSIRLHINLYSNVIPSVTYCIGEIMGKTNHWKTEITISEIFHLSQNVSELPRPLTYFCDNLF